jgi:hypothetical protein
MNLVVTACLAAISWLPTASTDALPPGHSLHIVVPSGARIAAGPLGSAFERLVESQPDLVNLRQYIETVTGRDVNDVLKAALGGSIEFGVYSIPTARSRDGAPPRARRHIVATAKGGDARSMAAALEDVLVVLEGLGLSVSKRGYRGLEIVVVDRQVSLCRLRDRLFLATKSELLSEALDRHLDGDRTRSRTPREGLAGFSLQFG